MALNIEELIALAGKLDEEGRFEQANKLDAMIKTLAGKTLDLHKKKQDEREKIEEFLAKQKARGKETKVEEGVSGAEPEDKPKSKPKKRETAKEKERREDEEEAKRTSKEEKDESIRQFKETHEKRMSDIDKFLDPQDDSVYSGQGESRVKVGPGFTEPMPPEGESILEWTREQQRPGETERKETPSLSETIEKNWPDYKGPKDPAEIDWSEHKQPSGAVLKIVKDMKDAGWQVFAPGELEYWLDQKGYEHPSKYEPKYEEDEGIPGVEPQQDPGGFDIDIESPQDQPELEEPNPDDYGSDEEYMNAVREYNQRRNAMVDALFAKFASDLPPHQPKSPEDERESIPGAMEASMPILKAFKSFLDDPQKGYDELMGLVEDYKEKNKLPEEQPEWTGMSEEPAPQEDQTPISDDEASSAIEQAEREKGVVWSSARRALEKLASVADRLDSIGAVEEAGLVDGFMQKYAEDFLDYQGEDTESEQSKRYDSEYHHSLQIREPKTQQERIDREGREKHHVHTMQSVEANALSTRYCPEHVGVSLGRVGESTYQCPLDGAVFNWETGWTDYDGNAHPGGSVAAQTPDSSGYDTPHRMFDSRENISNRVN